jgi:hypothetical protein
MTENSSQGTVTCLNCGTQSPDGARFCPVCGQALDATQAPPWASPATPTPAPVAPTPAPVAPTTAPLPPAPPPGYGPQPQAYGQPPAYPQPQAYGQPPAYPPPPAYAPAPARNNSTPIFVGLGVIALVAVLVVGAQIVSSGGAHATPTPSGIALGSPTASPSLVPTASPTGFSPTGSLADARYSHTATLLSDGRVLIAGGTTVGSTLLASAELYDPMTGKFSPTGSMATARNGHTATLLADGRVLIAGGGNDTSAYLTSAELYQP